MNIEVEARVQVKPYAKIEVSSLCYRHHQILVAIFENAPINLKILQQILYGYSSLNPEFHNDLLSCS